MIARPCTMLRARRVARTGRDVDLVLNILRCVPDMSGAELARRTGLAPARLYAAVERLEARRQLSRTYQHGVWRYRLVGVHQ